MTSFNKALAGLILAGLTQAAMGQTSSQLLFGDTHLHTSYSFDAYLNKNQTADPDTAYRWARGLPVIHPFNRARMQINTPLDFLVVSDHAELMGVIRAINLGTADQEDLGWWGNLKTWFAVTMLNRAIEGGDGGSVFNSILPKAPLNPGGDPVADGANEMPTDTFGDTLATETTAWHEIVDAAERHNKPGQFTTFIGWEWSSIPTGANLHRIVFTPDAGDKAKQFVPFGSDQSQYPEDLWQWLEDTRDRTGARFVAMPHNANISKGYMYAETSLKGEPITAEYARRRMAWEPVSEVTQIKGDSETHPRLSPDDEFADFETYSHYIQQESQEYKPTKADYARSALLTGLQLEQVYNVAWSGDRQLDGKGKLSPVGNTVELDSGHYDNSIGAEQLSTLWTDPDFDPSQRAFYYVRVLQIPTPRHSLYDAIALQSDVPEEGPATIQERAYTSPIWYTP